MPEHELCQDDVDALMEAKRARASLWDIVRYLNHAIEDITTLPPDQWADWAMYAIEELASEIGDKTRRLMFLNDVLQAVNRRMQDVPDL